MQVDDFITLYRQDNGVKSLVEQLQAPLLPCIQIKGLVGSLDAVVATAIAQQTSLPHLFILSNPEEASAFYSDLQHLQNTVLWYPAATTAVYDAARCRDEAYGLQMALLYRVIQDPIVQIVTYPAALTEKVVCQEVFQQYTYLLKPGDTCSLSALTTLLTEQGFEQVDFVYEVGQFAIRSKIIDVFTYAHLPYRIELGEDTVTSLRSFDPASQQSVDTLAQIALFSMRPVQHSVHLYQSLLDFLPATTVVWIKSYAALCSTVEQYYQDTVQSFRTRVQPPALLPPEALVETPASWQKALQKHTVIEFGHQFSEQPATVLHYDAAPQPAFNQNFALLADHIAQHQQEGLATILTAISIAQLKRLQTILAEREVPVSFQAIQLGLREGYIDRHLGMVCYTDHQFFNRYYRGNTPKQGTQHKAITLRELQLLQPGDYIVHSDYGIGRFAGLYKKEVNGKQQEVFRLVYKDNDLVYLTLHALHKISKYSGKEGVIPALSKLGTTTWEHKKKSVKRKVKEIAKGLIQLYAQRKQAQGFAFGPDNELQAALASSFMYEDTPDQVTAIAAIKKDMEAPHPMDRLVCGDVGFGKTEIAIRTAFKAVNDGKQVAVLVPTTILALQHYYSFKRRLQSFSVAIDYINRFRKPQEIQHLLQHTAAGKIDILIGTHKILNQKTLFQDLGLLIIDEEQRFGVAAKERIKEMKVAVDVLTLTATPIPRTLQFSLMGARDLSILATPPANRQAITTAIHPFNTAVIKEAILYEIQRGGQVFFVHNQVATIEAIAHQLAQLVPDCRMGVVHGQMESRVLEQRMIRFIEGAYDVLVATSIIESGLDIANANTIIVNESQRFGLSDLHQLRGRVGRSNKKAFCYLLAPPMATLTAEARKRLSALELFSELGDGFKVAMRDLDIRGAGNLLGAEQSGFMADIGFDTYYKVLEEAVQELKEGEFKALFAGEQQASMPTDCTLETDMEVLIPDTYVSNVTERLHLYTRLNHLQDEAAFVAFQEELRDRFGLLPPAMETLIQTVQLRWIAQKLGFQKIRLKEGVMQCYCTAHTTPASSYTQIWKKMVVYVQQNPHHCRLQTHDTQLVLCMHAVLTLQQAITTLTAIGALPCL